MTPHGKTSLGAWLASAPQEEQERFLEDLGPDTVLALPYLFDFWAHPHQLAPAGDWRTWVIMGGRGAGKTRAGSEWIRANVEGARPMDRGKARRVALIGETFDQTREVMVFGDSGILACSPPDRRPVWEASRRRLVWPNGAVAEVLSANDYEGLRGPQFDLAWADELAKWRKAEEAWDMLQFALRLGDDPRQCVTTTPRNVGVLKSILSSPSTVTTHAPTEANRANLADSFLQEVRSRYAGSILARQELDGHLVEDFEGALWRMETLAYARVEQVPDLTRIVVAVDPPTTGSATSDECGIIVAGVDVNGSPSLWRAYVIEDATVRGASPTDWARAAVDAYHRHQADRIVAETNQGGEMVATVVRQVDAMVPYRSVRAVRSKQVRAEPVAALYEQHRVFHLGELRDLEDQMQRMTLSGYRGKGSPDRVDALVWAIHDLMIEPAGAYQRPRMRTLG